MRDGLCRVACSVPGREGLRVGPPWDLLGWAWRVDCLGLVVPALLLLGPVGAGLGLRRVCGSWRCSDELGFWEEEDSRQEADNIKRQLRYEQVLIPMVLEHDSTNY